MYVIIYRARILHDWLNAYSNVIRLFFSSFVAGNDLFTLSGFTVRIDLFVADLLVWPFDLLVKMIMNPLIHQAIR